MSDEEWIKSVATFQSVIDKEASDDRAIQEAWDVLRHDYRNKFNAKVSPHGTQQNEEPFGHWAAENLSDLKLERVLCLIFRKELAGCNHMTLLKSTSAKAGITVWHLLLFFGASMFSESLLGHVRKRIRVFDKDPVSGTSAFKGAYMKVLQATAQRTKIAVDTTAISAMNSGRMFSSPDLAAMASANPEFDLPSARKAGAATGSHQARGQGPAHAPASSIQSMPKPSTTGRHNRNKQSGSSASTQGREDGSRLAPTGGEVIKQSIESNIPDRQPDLAGHFPTGSRLDRSESEGQRSYLPSVAQTSRPNTDGNTSTRRNPPRKGRPGSIYAEMPSTIAGDAAQTNNGGNAIDPEIKIEPSVNPRPDRPAPAPADEEPPTRVGSTIHVAQEQLQATLKRPLKLRGDESSTPGKDRLKRPNKVATRGDLLDRNQDWDDETVFTILKQLEATRHAEYSVIDGMRDDISMQPQLIGDAARRGSLLVPLRVAAEQRLLVVIDLNSTGGLEGILRYYDPGEPQEDRVANYFPSVKLLSLLSHVLPGRDLNPTRWKWEYCVCPELFCEQDSGLMICLGAIYAVGGRPLPSILDWTFWKHLLLGAFFHDDAAVQLRVARYRDGTVHKLIRQGQMSDGALVPQGRRASSDIEYLGTAAMNPVDRIECRADNAKKIIGAIHEGCRIFHNLQEHLDMGNADLKTRLDKSTHIRDSLRYKLNIGDKIVLGVPSIKTEEDDEGAEAFNRITLQQAIEEYSLCQTRLGGLADSSNSIRNALHELAIWRREANAIVLEDDASLEAKQAG
ncbi:hypothetical protein Daus18300_005827 [Diaporthe australafricana]|uniref:Uncharacterized protein n=1 Tax=Diaporthe australafricana TaxID=127596 RepID=A0ABR3WYW5_9PEZI